jgi:DNA-binding response OmpR family regulator
MKLPYRILILDDDEQTLAGLVELLGSANYSVTAAATYDAAKRLLAVGSYDLLITDVRLRGFNGLHLVRQNHRDRPEMATIIMTGFEEPMVQLEAGRYGATYVAKPIRPAEFMQTVARCLADIHRTRRSPRKRVIGGFRVSANGRPAAVVDVCYSGLRLEMPADERLPPTLDIEIAGIGLHLEVEVVWCQPAVEGAAVICGATLASEGTPAARTWRAIVDRLSV